MKIKNVDLYNIPFEMLGKEIKKEWKKEWKDNFAYWDGCFNKKVTKQYKISLCTTVMQRCEDLSKTFLKNIKDNSDYPNVEFVILDYNSSDGLEDWIKSNVMDYIEKGIVSYYRTVDEYKYFSLPHSKNLAFLAASGDIVHNVDADNYTNKGFCTYINKLANQVTKNCIFVKGKFNIRGRIGFYKDDFINKLGGYNESMKGYSPDDRDIYTRAISLGLTLVWYGNNYQTRLSRFDRNNDKEPDRVEQFEHKNIYNNYFKDLYLSYANCLVGNLKVNKDIEWGKGKLIKNFKEVISNDISRFNK